MIKLIFFSITGNQSQVSKGIQVPAAPAFVLDLLLCILGLASISYPFQIPKHDGIPPKKHSSEGEKKAAYTFEGGIFRWKKKSSQ